MKEAIELLKDYGMWTILVLWALKFGTGVLVAIQDREFKWFYLADTFRNDGVKVAVYLILANFAKFGLGTLGVESDNIVLEAGGGAIILAGFLGGFLKNLQQLTAASFSTSLTEPREVRLAHRR